MLEPLSHEKNVRGESEKRIIDIDPENPFRKGLEYTPPARGTWTIAHTPMMIPDSIEIFVCPEGCLRGVVLSVAEFDGMDRFAMITVKEKNLYDGHMEDLFINGVTHILENRKKPKVVFLFSSCIHHFLSTDIDLIHNKLSERFPEIKFIPADMNCIMRNSKINHEVANNRQLYKAIPNNLKKKEKQINIIGNYFSIKKDSELIDMLKGNGYSILELPNIKSFNDYEKMGESSLNIYTMPLGYEAVCDLEKRLNQPFIYSPYAFDYEEIRKSVTCVAKFTNSPLPNLDLLEKEADFALEYALEKLKTTEIQIDATATPRPFELGALLLKKGFNVTVIYADNVSKEEIKSFNWLQKNHPNLKVRSIVNFRGRLNPRDEASKVDHLVAIGQKAAYFSGTDHFVNLIFNSGLHGFKGIIELSDLIVDAYENAKPMKEIIQIKAWGCKT